MASLPEGKEKITQANLHFDYEVAECVRPFKLPKQFPSTRREFQSSQQLTLDKNTSTTSKPFIKNISLSPNLISNGKMSFIPNKEILAGNFQKLKLKLSSGKDLGEVKILNDQSSKLKTQLGSLSKIINQKSCTVTSTSHEGQSLLKTVSTIIGSSSKKVFKESSKMPNLNLHTISNDENITKSPIKFKTLTPKPAIISNISGANSLQQSILVRNADNKLQRVIFVQPNEKNKQSQDQIKKIDLQSLKNGHKLVFKKNESSSSKINLEDFTNNYNRQKDLEKKFLETGNYFPGQKRPLVSEKCFESSAKKLCLDKSFNNLCRNEIVLSSDEDSDDQRLKFRLKSHVPKGKISIQMVPKDSLKLQNNSNHNQIEDKFSKHYKLPNSYKSKNSILESEDLDDSDVNYPSTELDNSNFTSLTKTVENNKNDEISNSSDKINILKKALSSIEDKKLREEAIKALNDYGIKVAKSVPAKSPPRKIIKESTTQTAIFSLLKNESFIEVDKNYESIKTIKFGCMDSEQDDDSLNKISSEYQLNWQIELNKMLDGIDNKNTQDIKQTLEKNKRSVDLAKILLKQLNLEFEKTKNFDEDGFLGIHRAVFNNEIHQVQKSLIILKACKLNVDIETQDYKTCLELAIEYEVNPQIVKILLDAGAQPVSSKARHDSALILAAKKSSKMLNQLLKNINESNRSLIDAKDSEGLAPIHYCTKLGNLEGVRELIQFGADINLIDDKSGRTALFYAIESGNNTSQEIYYEIAQKLIENGAISNIPTFSKHTTLSLIDNVKSQNLKIALIRAVI